MTEAKTSKRAELVRESLVFQLKLVVDGFRDFLLVPVSLVATLVGLLRSADDPEVEYNRVLDLGRKSERWINLFGQHDPIEEAGDAGSLDRLVMRVEEVLKDEAARGDISDTASKAIGRALDTVQETLRREHGMGDRKGSGKPQ